MAARRPLVVLAPALAVLAIAGCTTPQSKPVASRAVLDALAHKDVKTAAAQACPNLASPQSVGFGFGDATLKDVAMESLEAVAAALSCHPTLQADIAGAADAHGTSEEQTKLANSRAQAVADYLQAHGVAVARIHVLPPAQDKPPPGDAEHLVVMAEGRRW